MSAEPTLRRDAAENRGRLLAAAVEVFNAEGPDATVARISRAAGVGMGTLYRHFPNKEALVEALVQDQLEATIAMARGAARQPDGLGLERFLEAAGTHQAEHPGLLTRLWTTDHEMVRTARRLISKLLSDAKDHGRIRQDVTITDLTIAFFGIRGVLETTRAEAPDAWRRHLEIIVAGLRPGGAELRHPPLSQPRLDRALTIADRPPR